MMATGQERFVELLDKQNFQMINSFKEIYIDALKQYYFVGEMPEAVQNFADNKDFNEVRVIQKRILMAYEDLKAFMFVLNVGLLGCMVGLNQRTLLDGNYLFVEFKGALTEQYVCQQLKTIEDLGFYYYTNDCGSCEVDYVVDTGELIAPVEVIAEANLKAKSLKTFRDKFSPEISVRTSMANYKDEDWLINLPLYAIEQISDVVNKKYSVKYKYKKLCFLSK